MRILFVVHGFPPRAIGGTELHAHRLALALRERGHEIFVFAREGDTTRADYSVRDERRDGLAVRFVVNNQTRLDPRGRTDCQPEIRAIFRDYLVRCAPDVVHIHHLLALSMDLPAVLEDLSLPYAVTVHDYWLACDRIRLLRLRNERCDGPDAGRACARFCRRDALSRSGSLRRLAPGLRRLGLLPSQNRLIRRVRDWLRSRAIAAPPADEVAFWRGRVADGLAVLSRAGAVIAPSSEVMRRLQDWGVPAAGLRTVPHGIDRPVVVPPWPIENAVGYLGAMIPSKGVHVALEAARFLPRDYRLHLWGHGDDRVYANELRRLGRRAAGRVAFEGMMPPGSLPEVMARLRVVVVPSLWDETFCLVAHEALSYGRLLTASRLGALRDLERIDRAYLVPPDDPKALAQAVISAMLRTRDEAPAPGASSWTPGEQVAETERILEAISRQRRLGPI